MKSRDIQSISENLNRIMETSNEINLQCLSYLNAIQTIHGSLQELLSIHNKFPEPFSKDDKVANSILEFIDLSKKLSSDTEKTYFAKIRDAESNVESIKQEISKLQKSPEFVFFEKNISFKLDCIEDNLTSINSIKNQLKLYIDYQNRILEAIVKK